MTPLHIFNHIPKTAGTTLTQVLRREYRQKQILDLGAVPAKTRPAAVATLPGHIRLLVGHTGYGQHQYTPRPCQYFTMLRQPEERVTSLYYYMRREPAHPLYAKLQAGEMSFLECARWRPNVQTHLLAGNEGTYHPGTQEDLDRAKAHLRHGYTTFGLMHRFDESLVLFKQAFGWSLRRGYQAANVTTKATHKPTPPDVRAAIQEANQLDLELYAYAEELFTERLQQAPHTFAGEVATLRNRVQWARQMQEWRRRLTAWQQRR